MQQALHTFASVDVLDGDNKYRCPATKRLVRAQRSTRIQEPPNVLTLHLKRFEFAMFGKKVNRHVAFTQELNLAPYLHESAPAGNHWCGSPARVERGRCRCAGARTSCACMRLRPGRARALAGVQV